MFKISAKIGVTAFSAFALFAMSVSPLHAQTVSCSSSGPNSDLQQAINNAAAGSELHVTGNCDDGPYQIVKDLKLFGSATLSAGAGQGIVLNVRDHSVEITNLTIDADGVNLGIRVLGGSLQLNNVVVEGAVGTGVTATENSSVRISGSVVRNNATGINITIGSGGNVRNTTIENNTDFGLIVSIDGRMVCLGAKHAALGGTRPVRSGFTVPGVRCRMSSPSWDFVEDSIAQTRRPR